MPKGVELFLGEFLCNGDCVWEEGKCQAKVKPPVSCGNMERPSCKDCVPKDYPYLGKTLCNGECSWNVNKCEPKNSSSCIGPDWACKLPAPIKVDCKLSPWTTWSPCSNTCSRGTSSRKRSVIQKEQNGGMACPRLHETNDCNKPQCPGAYLLFSFCVP